MELQPGQVNWGAVNPQPYPGAVRNWILRAFALGSKLLCTHRYRQPLFGNEQYHAGIVGTDGVTLSRGGEEWVQAMAEIRRLRDERPAKPVEPTSMPPDEQPSSITSTTASTSTITRRPRAGTRWRTSSNISARSRAWARRSTSSPRTKSSGRIVLRSRRH
jgi:beta-galactosidase GanA